MKKILVSSALTLSAFFLLASASAKAQQLFFKDAYARPAEMVDGLHVGARFDFGRQASRSAGRHT